MKVLTEVLDDIVDISGYKDEGSSKIVKSIKNVLSDRCITQKKFNALFKEYRSDVVPNVVKDWSSLSDNDKENVTDVNEFFCGLHYLVGLADVCEHSLKAWDILSFNGANVGSLANGGYSNGYSGTSRLIFSLCKAVQERGCQRSDRPAAFKNFLCELGIFHVPLVPFKGNRFNVLFLNAASLYSIYEPACKFFENHLDDNKLMASVYHDLNVAQYKIACQALGLIDKYVTGPLWRVIVRKEGNVLEMNVVYQTLLEKFKHFAPDSSDLISGAGVIYPDETHSTASKDFENLRSVPDEETTLALKQCLELIMSSFVVVTQRMLQEHLHNGIYEQKMQSIFFFVKKQNQYITPMWEMKDHLVVLELK